MICPICFRRISKRYFEEHLYVMHKLNEQEIEEWKLQESPTYYGDGLESDEDNRISDSENDNDNIEEKINNDNIEEKNDLYDPEDGIRPIPPYYALNQHGFGYHYPFPARKNIANVSDEMRKFRGNPEGWNELNEYIRSPEVDDGKSPPYSGYMEMSPSIIINKEGNHLIGSNPYHSDTLPPYPYSMGENDRSPPYQEDDANFWKRKYYRLMVLLHHMPQLYREDSYKKYGNTGHSFAHWSHQSLNFVSKAPYEYTRQYGESEYKEYLKKLEDAMQKEWNMTNETPPLQKLDSFQNKFSFISKEHITRNDFKPQNQRGLDYGKIVDYLTEL